MDERFKGTVALLWSMSIFGASVSADAQTVNAEALTRDVEGFAAEVAGTFALRRGNVTITDLGGSAHAQYQTLHPDEASDDETAPFVRHRWFANGGARYASNAEDTVVSQSFAHARWTAMWIRRLGSELFAQHQYNEFQRLQARLLGGIGARAVLVNLYEFRLAIGSGYMLEYERLTPAVAGTDDPETLAHRWTNFINVRVELFEKRLVIGATAYAQPRIDDFSDHRILEQAQLDVKVTDTLSLGTAVTIAHDSEPPTSVEPTDISFLQTIKLSF